jgi:hypothetical protein
MPNKKGMTYTVVDAAARQRGDPDATIVYEGFTNYRTDADFIAIVDHDGETELWSVAVEGGLKGEPVPRGPSARGIAELKRYYRDAWGSSPGGHRARIRVYARVGLSG